MSVEPQAETHYEPLLEREGVSVSRSPWGPDDEIGRMNWITPESKREVLEQLDGDRVFDLGVEYFFGMPSWSAARDPQYGIWMTHTPQGPINDNLSGAGAAGPREVLLLRRLDPHVHPLRHPPGHAQPPRLLRDVLERLDARSSDLGSRAGSRAAPRSTRRSSPAPCSWTSPACTAWTACPPATSSRRNELRDGGA